MEGDGTAARARTRADDDRNARAKRCQRPRGEDRDAPVMFPCACVWAAAHRQGLQQAAVESRLAEFAPAGAGRSDNRATECDVFTRPLAPPRYSASVNR